MVRIQGELSDSFELDKGLRQGDALSPVLLISVMRRMSQQQIMEVNEYHTLLACANDIIIMGDTKQLIASSNENRQIYGAVSKSQNNENICVRIEMYEMKKTIQTWKLKEFSFQLEQGVKYNSGSIPITGIICITKLG